MTTINATNSLILSLTIDTEGDAVATLNHADGRPEHELRVVRSGATPALALHRARNAALYQWASTSSLVVESDLTTAWLTNVTLVAENRDRIPVRIVVVEKTPRAKVREIADRQGWNDDALLALAVEWINLDKRRAELFLDHVTIIADGEG